MHDAVHAATAVLPHLRRGLTRAAPRRRRAPADADRRAGGGGRRPGRLLAFDGVGADHHRPGDALDALVGRRGAIASAWSRACAAGTRPARCARRSPRRCSSRSTASARWSRSTTGPAASGSRSRASSPRRPRSSPRCSSCLEVEAQGERLARAELRALRAQISPHFIYNALAAVASFIHSRPDEARELLTEFAEFIRYGFARERSYVTLADELRYVEQYPAGRSRPASASGCACACRSIPRCSRPSSRAVAPAAGRERRPPRRRVALGGRDGGDRGGRPRLRRRAARHRRRGRDRRRAGGGGAGRPRRWDRARQRGRAAAVHVRRGLRAGGGRRGRAGAPRW